jgi:hypothetical protein
MLNYIKVCGMIDFKDIELSIIYDAIISSEGRTLLQDEGILRIINSQLLLILEKEGLINISGKTIPEKMKIDFTNIEFTDRGRDEYRRIQELHNGTLW